MNERISIVTGPTSGIGKEIARNLAHAGHHVVLACRNVERGIATRRELEASAPGASFDVMLVDTSSVESIRRFAERVAERYPAVHVLVNNAGGWFSARRESVDGIELTLATNAVGPYFLTRALAAPLAAGRGRVVNIGSHLAGSLDLDDLQITRRAYKGFSDAYSASKQALIMLSHQLHEELSGRGISVNVAEPGWVRTNAHRHAFFLQRFIMNLAGSIGARTPQKGAETPTWVALAPELEGLSGRRYQDGEQIDVEFDDTTETARLCEGIRELVQKRAPSPRTPASERAAEI